MARKREPIPVFKDKAEERRFWETHDSADSLTEVTPSRNAQSGGEPWISAGWDLNCWHVTNRKSPTDHESV